MNIDVLLKERGLTKVALAEKLGIKKQNVNGLLKNPTLSTLEKIAGAIGVPMWELFASKADVIGGQGNGTTIVCPHCGNAISLKVE